jgi:hypothetical protein
MAHKPRREVRHAQTGAGAGFGEVPTVDPGSLVTPLKFAYTLAASFDFAPWETTKMSIRSILLVALALGLWPVNFCAAI